MSRTKTYEELYKRAIKVAQIKGYHQDAYDFAGWITERWLSGKAQHQSLEYSLIDYLRAEYGGTGDRRGSDAILRTHRAPETSVPGLDAGSAEENLERMWARSSNAPLNDPRLAQSERSYCDPARYLRGSSLDIWRWSTGGRKLSEIGNELGVSESRASQMLTRAKTEIIRFEGLRRMNELVEEGRTTFEIEWITL